MTKLPNWNDLKGLSEHVRQSVDSTELSSLLEEAWRLEHSPPYHLSLRERFELFEQNALRAAEEGDFRLLADLLDSRRGKSDRWGWYAKFRAADLRISPAAEASIADFLRRAKRPARRASTAEELRAGSPNYESAELVEAYQAILERDFPTEKDHREKAIAIVTEGDDSAADTLRNFMRKGKHLYHHADEGVVGDPDDDIGFDTL